MATEEKARAYDEAIKRAKQFVEHPLLEDSKNVVTYILPHLTESEDERIRKALISAVKKYDTVDGIEQEKVLSWLKKQKEHKPVEWREEDEKKFELLLKAGHHYVNCPSVEYEKREEFSKTVFADKDWLDSIKPQPQHPRRTLEP